MADYQEIAKQALERHRAERQTSSDRPPFPHRPSAPATPLQQQEEHTDEVIDLPTDQKYYTPQQLAKAKNLPMTPQTIVRQFKRGPGA